MFHTNYSAIVLREGGGRLFLCHDCSIATEDAAALWCPVDGYFGDPHCCSSGHVFIAYCIPCTWVRLKKFWRSQPTQRVTVVRLGPGDFDVLTTERSDSQVLQ